MSALQNSENPARWRRDQTYPGSAESKTRTKDTEITEIKIFAQQWENLMLGRQFSEEKIGVCESSVVSLSIQEDPGPPHTGGVCSGILGAGRWAR